MRQTADGKLEDQGRALIVQVGGDTMQGLAMLLDGASPQRPLTLDLLWTVRRSGSQLPALRQLSNTYSDQDAAKPGSKPCLLGQALSILHIMPISN